MKNLITEYDAVRGMKRVFVNIRVRRARELRIRNLVAGRLFLIAGWIAGFGGLTIEWGWIGDEDTE